MERNEHRRHAKPKRYHSLRFFIPYDRNCNEQSLLDSIGTDALGLYIADVNHTLRTGKRSVKRREREERQRTFQRPQKGKKVVRWHDLCCLLLFGIYTCTQHFTFVFVSTPDRVLLYPSQAPEEFSGALPPPLLLLFYFSHDATDA